MRNYIYKKRINKGGGDKEKERNEKGKKKVGKICALNSPYWTLGGDKKKRRKRKLTVQQKSGHLAAFPIVMNDNIVIIMNNLLKK